MLWWIVGYLCKWWIYQANTLSFVIINENSNISIILKSWKIMCQMHEEWCQYVSHLLYTMQTDTGVKINITGKMPQYVRVRQPLYFEFVFRNGLLTLVNHQGWGQIRFIKYKYKYKNLDFSNTNTNTNILLNFVSNTNTNTNTLIQIQIQIQIRSTKYICRNCSDPK